MYPPNLCDGLWASMPTLCMLIYMKRTAHSFTILRRIVIHIDAESVNIVCGNILPGWNDTTWRVRQVFVTSTTVGCTTRHHPCFNDWTMKESPSSTHWDSTLIERPSTSNASLTERIYLPAVIACSGSFVTFRWVWVWLPTCRARDSALLCHRRRLGQIGGFYDAWSRCH